LFKSDVALWDSFEESWVEFDDGDGDAISCTSVWSHNIFFKLNFYTSQICGAKKSTSYSMQ
jgi:hypothetical protein